MKKKLTGFIFNVYQTVIKTIFYIFGVKNGQTCKFHPTCSQYAKECFIKYPFLKACMKTLKRVIKCHPWSLGGVDLP